jgi:hypothetical protein
MPIITRDTTERLVSLGTLLDNVPADSGATARTVIIPCQKASKITLMVLLIYDAGTTLTIEPYLSIDNGVTYGRLQVRSINSLGLANSMDFLDVKDIDGNLTAVFEYSATNFTHMKFVFSITDGTASDQIFVQGAMMTR